MAFIEVNTKWTVVGNGGGGLVASGQGTAFNTDTKQIEQWYDSVNQSINSAAPPDANLPVGAFLWFDCDTNYTATKYFYAGGMDVRVETEANSVNYCNYPVPLTCELGTVTVQQRFPSGGGATLTVLLSGTAHGTLYYSLDGGVTEQISPVFLKVVDGPYTVLVRDDGLADCTRTLGIVVATPPPAGGVGPPAVPVGPAEGVDFVQQPLWFGLDGALPRGRVELELFAESSHGAEDFALVHTLRKVADARGYSTFRLDALLLSLLRPFVPTPAAYASRCRGSLVNYFVRTAIYDAAGVATYQVGPLRTALRGGLPAEWQAINYFLLRESSFALPPCLSWQPSGPGVYAEAQPKPITRQQPEWLFWLSHVDAPDLRIARAYDMGPGTVPVVDYAEIPGNPPPRGWLRQLLAIPLAATRKGFTRLMVQVQTQAGVPLSLPAWYTFIEEPPRSRYLLFSNSVGGVDTLRCEGRLEATLEATTEKVERPAVLGTGAPAADRQVADLTASRKLKLTTGWLNPAELAWVQELVLTRELWQLVDGQLRPLDWPKRSLAAYSDEPGLRKLQLDFDYAYAPTAYAPGIY
jgi:hypothetical protein